MSKWEDLYIQDSIVQILSTAPSFDPDHHFGCPFMTAYQIAIKFADDYPEKVRRLNKEIGGKGTGRYDSLSQYLALELSKKIKNRQITNIEGAFLSNLYVKEMTFNDYGTNIESSVSGNQASLSMYRLIT